MTVFPSKNDKWQSMIALWVEEGGITWAVFGSSMYPMKLCQICQSTNFYFYLLSKVFMTVFPSKYDKWQCSTKIWQMTVLHQNLRNDRAPPKFEKWPCSTEKSQFLIFICPLRFLWIFHASGSIKIGMWFFQTSGPLKFCQICQSTNFNFYPVYKISFWNYLIGSLKKLGSYGSLWLPFWVNRSRAWKFHVPGPMKFCQICQSTNFYFFISFLRFLRPCSTKIWQMTMLHQNMTNDRAPPKFEKWPCSTKI